MMTRFGRPFGIHGCLMACGGMLFAAGALPAQPPAEDGSAAGLPRASSASPPAQTPINTAVRPAHPAAGELPAVALIAAASNDLGDPWFTDPRDQLLATGRFASVDLIHAGQTTPSLAELQGLDAVLVWSNLNFADAGLLGDVLADYVDQGGGVVLCTFANSSNTPGRLLGGRWLAGGYDILPPGSGTASGAAALGAMLEPEHPVLADVEAFAGGSNSYRPAAEEVIFPARVLAEWDDGRILAAIRDDTVGARVELGMYPPSDAVLPGFWEASSDGDWLMAGALHFAATRRPLTEGDSDGDADLDLHDFARLQACFQHPANGVNPAGCVTFDSQDNGATDLADAAAFINAFTGPVH